MHLKGTHGPDRGSMTVLFACPSCGHQTAMLTNTMETQVVRSLGVKIGGRTVPAEPMEMVRGSLVGSKSHEPDPQQASMAPDEPDDDAAAPGGPNADAAGGGPYEPTIAPAGAPHAHEGSKCPFTGMVNEAFAQKESVRWTEGARRRIERIPEFARNMVMKGVEDTARAQGLQEITEAVLDDVRGQLGM